MMRRLRRVVVLSMAVTGVLGVTAATAPASTVSYRPGPTGVCCLDEVTFAAGNQETNNLSIDLSKGDSVSLLDTGAAILPSADADSLTHCLGAGLVLCQSYTNAIGGIGGLTHAGTKIGQVNVLLKDGNDHLTVTGTPAPASSRYQHYSYFGDDGDDTITTGAADDNLFGGSGRDTLSSGAGNDVIDSSDTDDGADTIDCGSGQDTAYVSPHDTVTNCEDVQVFG